VVLRRFIVAVSRCRVLDLSLAFFRRQCHSGPAGPVRIRRTAALAPLACRHENDNDNNNDNDNDNDNDNGNGNGNGHGNSNSNSKSILLERAGAQIKS
jgi:hypothetical protein